MTQKEKGDTSMQPQPSDPEEHADQCGEQVFTLRDRDMPINALDVFNPWNKVGRPPLCHVDVKIGKVVCDACIDSGATFTLLSE